MATSVGLNFRLTAAVDKFEASMKDVERRLGGVEKATQSTANGMRLLAAIEVGKLLVGGLTKVFNVISSGVSTVQQFASQAAAAADAIGKLSSATGMAEEPLQVFTQLASYSGVSSTQFGDALQKMSRGLGEAANGTGTAKRALEQLGLSVNGLLAMSPDQQFMKIGAAIGQIEDPARRSAIAADVFGRSGTKLIPMFDDLESNVKATAAEMLELGQVLSGTQVDNIEAMNDSFEKVRQTAFKIGTQVLANFAPAITKANEQLLEFIKNFEYQGLTGGQGLVQFASDALEKVVKALASAFDNFINTFKGFVEAILWSIDSFLTNLSIFAAPIVGDEASVKMLNAAQAAEHMMLGLQKMDSNVRGFVDGALANLRTASGEAAVNVNSFIAGIGPAGTSFGDFVDDVKSAGEVVAKPLVELGQAVKRTAKAATDTWSPLKGIDTYGSLAVAKMGQLAIGLANNAASNKLTAAEVERLGKAAKAASDEMPKPPKSMEMSMEEFSKIYGDAQGTVLEMLRDAQKQRFNKGTIDSYMDRWQSTADNLMEMYKRSGKYSADWLEQKMKFDRDNFRQQLENFQKSKIGMLTLENQIRKDALEEYRKNGMAGGLFGDTSLDDGVDPETGLPLRELEDPAWADDLNIELSDQTALLGQIRDKIQFAATFAIS